MSAPAIVFNAFSRRYGELTAVEDVTFSVTPGRIVGLVGRNGAGKSTCLRGLLGLLAPSSGRVEVLGSPYAELADGGRRVGAVMDGLGANPAVRAGAHLRIVAARLGERADRANAAAEQAGLESSVLRRRVKTLSTGQRQRLGLAAALVTQPELLVLDEPTNGLDPDGVLWMRELLREFADTGRTVLVASHHLSELEQCVDDVVILDRTVRFAGPLAELTREGSSLEERYVELTGRRRGPAFADASANESSDKEELLQ